MNRPSKVDRKELKRLWEKGLTDRQIAPKLDVCASTIHRTRVTMGLEENYNRHELCKPLILKLIAEDLTLREIVDRLNAETRFTWDRNNLRRWMLRHDIGPKKRMAAKPKPKPTPLEAAVTRSAVFLIAYSNKWISDPWSTEELW